MISPSARHTSARASDPSISSTHAMSSSNDVSVNRFSGGLLRIICATAPSRSNRMVDDAPLTR